MMKLPKTERAMYERLLAEAKESLAKAEELRDYFRARADRLELMIVGRPKDPQESPKREINPKPVGRQRWEQLVANRLRENAELDRQEAAAKKSGIVTPAPATTAPATEETKHHGRPQVRQPRNAKAVRQNPRKRRRR
jgi:hypothetical protein